MNINQIMKQAKAMQDKIQKAQEELARKEFVGSSGGDMVKITITGDHKMIKSEIDPTLLNPEEADILEDLIIAAYNDAKKKVDEESSGGMNDMLGGLDLPPGFKMPF